MGYLEFLEIMTRWLEEPRFHRLLRFSQTRHWLDAQNILEANFRDFLAWVLDPCEGHGLGDYFIKRLMLTEAATNGHDWSALDVETTCFRNMFVVTEGRTPAHKRIDLLLVDATNKLLVMIERKDGAKVSPHQLGSYGEWANKHYPDYTQCWLVSDSQEKEHLHMRKGWNQLNDDWLIEALKDVTDKGHLSDTINRQFRDWIILLEGRGLWEQDTYYSNVEDEIKEFAASESQTVRALCNIQIKVGRDSYSIADIDTSVGLREILPRIDKEFERQAKSGMRTAVSLAMRHHYLLTSLIESNHLAAVEKEINAKQEFSGKFCTETSQGPRFHRLFVGLRRFDKLADWPVFIAIAKPVDDEDNSKPLRARLRMRVQPDLQDLVLPHTWQQMLDDIRAKYPKEFPRKTSARQVWVSSPWQELADLSADSLERSLRRLLDIEKMLFLRAA